jgi:hypothetical protein
MYVTQPTSQITLHYREKVDAYWASFLGCTPSALYSYGDTIARPHTSSGLFCLEVGDSRVLSLASDVHITPPHGPLSREWIYSSLMRIGSVQEVYGPGDLLYCTSDTFNPTDETICQPLGNTDQGILEQFADQMQWQCLPQDDTLSWDYAFGVYQDGKLVSAATTIIWGNAIAALKVATLPDYQERGYGRAVTSAVTSAILSNTHLIPQYDTAVSNRPSQRIARGLGFQHYGRIYYGILK